MKMPLKLDRAFHLLLPLDSPWARLALAAVIMAALSCAGWARFMRAAEAERLLRQHRHLFSMEQNAAAVADAELEERINRLHALAERAKASLFPSAEAASQRVASFEAFLQSAGWSIERLAPEPSARQGDDILASECYRIDFQAPDGASARPSADHFPQLDRLLRELRDEKRSLEIARLAITSSGQAMRQANITLVATHLSLDEKAPQ